MNAPRPVRRRRSVGRWLLVGLLVGLPDVGGLRAASARSSVARPGGLPDGLPYTSRQTISGLLRPVGMATGDLNGDGYSDLVVAGAGGKRLGLLLGGARGFGALRTMTLPAEPITVGAADLDRDGLADVVVLSRTAGRIYIFAGNRSAGLSSRPTVLTTDLYPEHLALADVTGDGVLDLIVTSTITPGVSVWSGRGNGTFPTAPAVWLPNTSYGQIATADLDGDGASDLALDSWTTGEVHTSSLLTPNSPAVRLRVGRGLAGLILADLNSDGAADLVTTLAEGGGTVTLTFSLGLATRSAPTVVRGGKPAALVALGGATGQVAVADPARGGITILSSSGGSLAALTGYGSGAAPALVALVPTRSGRPALAVADGISGRIVVFSGDRPALRAGDRLALPTAAEPVDLQLGDLTRSGRPGLVVLSRRGAQVTAWTPTASAAGPWRVPLPTTAGLATMSRLRLRPTTRPGGPTELMLLGSATVSSWAVDPATLAPTAAGSTRLSAFSPVWSAEADLNADGRTDWLLYEPSDLGSVPFVSAYLARGPGRYDEATLTSLGEPLGPPLATDLTGDGVADLAAVVAGGVPGAPWAIRLATAFGRFRYRSRLLDLPAIARLPVDRVPLLLAGRLAGDGVDLLAVVPGGPVWRLANRDGLGRFGRATVAAPGGSVPVGGSADLLDVDGDRRLDLVVFDPVGRTLGLCPGRGDGTFGPRQTLATGLTPGRVIAADLNGDGVLDLAVTDPVDAVLMVLFGRGGGRF